MLGKVIEKLLDYLAFRKLPFGEDWKRIKVNFRHISCIYFVYKLPDNWIGMYIKCISFFILLISRKARLCLAPLLGWGHFFLMLFPSKFLFSHYFRIWDSYINVTGHTEWPEKLRSKSKFKYVKMMEYWVREKS